MDARFTGYECYQGLDYSIFLASNSDCLDRYLLRFNEMIESCRIIYGIIFIPPSLSLSLSLSILVLSLYYYLISLYA